MIIKQVTVTGADESVSVESLLEIQKNFPYVEWGILLSKSSEGKTRFPKEDWIKTLNPELNLSGHLCGRWVRDICAGQWTFLEDRPEICGIFQRFQLNFHAYLHKIEQPFIDGFKHPVLAGKQFIFQLDDVNNTLLDTAQENGIDAVALFDTSGGIGQLPESWPQSRNKYCGYAGGLSPENLTEQLKKIAAVCGDTTIWIDAETRLRSDDDQQFMLDKVVRFLEVAKPYVG